jgi:hypothetical protein
MNDTPKAERTPLGLQYLIPGVEPRQPPNVRKYARDGNQLVLPGAERISIRQLLQRRMAEQMAARKRQRPIQATPLFKTKG